MNAPRSRGSKWLGNRRIDDPGINQFVLRGGGHWPAIFDFRHASRLHPVKGGRWFVRRNPHTGRWRAWSKGQASGLGRNFATHQEAIDWAQHVAATYVEHGNIAHGIIKNELERKRLNL